MARRKARYIGVNSTESYFMGLVYDFFSEIEDFTVTPTKSEFLQMFYSESTSVPAFNISHNGVTIQWKRDNSIAGKAKSYSVKIVTPETDTNISIDYDSIESRIAEEDIRAYHLELVYGDNILMLRMGNWQKTGATECEWLVLFANEDNSFLPLYSQSITTGRLSSKTFKTDVSNIGYNIVPICSYTVSNQEVDMIPYIIFKNKPRNNSEPITEKFVTINTNEIQYCTTVPANSLLTINNKKYYSIGTNLLVEIEEE